MKKVFGNLSKQNPIHLLIAGYLVLTAAGFLILSLPCVQSLQTSLIDNLFISVSAISTTGLTTVSVSDHYNFFGELIVMLLIQVGGLGYMSFGSFILLVRNRKMSRLAEQLIQSDFGLPKSFNVVSFIKMVVFFTAIVEILGAAGLYVIFKDAGVSRPLWSAVFHSVSAFCTAGFSLFNNSFEGFSGHPALNALIFTLSFLGAIGFIVVVDVWQRLRGFKKELTFTTKIILVFSGVTIAAGWVLLLLTEPVLMRGRDPMWMPALFQAMSAMTTVGFNTIPIASMSHGPLYLLTVLMLIGASPAGTGGGIKSTTIMAVLAETFATLRGQRVVLFCKRVIPDYRLQQASASFNFYILLLTLGIYLLNLTDSQLYIFDIMFEATSAIGTVGLSTGITASLSVLGKIVIITLMMLGRIGPLSIGLALFSAQKKDDDLWDAKYEDVVID